MSLLVLSSSDVDAITSIFSTQDLQLLMAEVFALISSKDAYERVSMPPRIVIPTVHHTALFMPAHIGTKISTEASSDLGILNRNLDRPSSGFALGGTAVKVVCVPAKSDPRGLPGTTLVLDEVSGGVKAVVNSRNLTALRNAAGSLLSTTLVGPSKPKKLVAFGAGKQIGAHLDLFIRHFPSISHCTIINRTINVRSNSLKETIKTRFSHINLHVISSQKELAGNNEDRQMEDAVRSADVIICATSSTVPLFPSSWVRTGTHVILIGSFTPAMREVERELVMRAVPQSVDSATYLLVDSRKACLEEAGELIEAKLEPHQITEIGEIVGRDISNGRTDEGFDGPITMFKSVGVGLQDVAIGCAVVEHALLSPGNETSRPAFFSAMVHRPADSRLLSNLLQQEKDYLKQFNLLFSSAAASLDSFTAYAAASPPPTSQVILAVAGLLASADDALKRYAFGVEQWRDAMRLLKDMEDDVGNIMRDREILVTRLIKVSKSHKSNSGSGTFRLIGERLNSASTLSLNHDSSTPSPSPSPSFPTSTKLAAAQSELQACETHLASKESELALKRFAAVREGLTTRAKAMIDCSWTWSQLGREILRMLDDLGVTEAHRNGQLPMPRDERNPGESDFSSIAPSQSASQIGHQHSESVPNTHQPPDDKGDSKMPRPHSGSSTAPSSLYYTPAMPATYKTETVTYAQAISLVVPPSLPSSPMGSDINTPLALGPSLDVGSLGLPATMTLSTYLPPDPESHKKMRIPAAHAINEYEIPTAKAAESGTGSGTWRHSRGESQEGLTWVGPQPQKTSFTASASEPNLVSKANMSSSMSNHQRHVLERRITEEDLHDNDPPIVDLSGGGGGQKAAPSMVVRSAIIEVFDDPENEEEDDELLAEVDQLVQQGKLAVVENPRFMSEERKRELEREREREQMKLAEQEEHDEPETEAEKEKKKFPFLHKRASTHGQGQSDTEHVTLAPTSANPSTPKSSPLKTGGNLPSSSPSKPSPSKRFFGSLRGLFGARQPPPQVPSTVQDSSPSRPRGRSPTRIRTVDSDVDAGDDSDDDPPTKTGGGFQAIFGAKKKAGFAGGSTGGSRWSTRTDRNIQKLTKSGDDDDVYDEYLSENVGKGAAGDVVVKAGLVGSVITGPQGARKRAVSDIGTAPVAASESTVNGGRKKLKKAFPPSTAAASASASHPSSIQRKNTTDGVAHATHPSTLTKKDTKLAASGRRSASADDNARRTNVVPQGAVVETPTGGGGGGGSKDVIVDLGKRRRTTSDVEGPPPSSVNAARISAVGGSATRGMPAATKTSAPATSAVSKGYFSDTAAAVSGQVVLSKKSVVRNAGPAPTAASVSPATTSKVTPPVATATATPSKPTVTRQTSVGKSQTRTIPNTPIDNVKAGGPRQPLPHRQHSSSSSAIVLPAGGTHPSGTLISQPGWDAQALPSGGGLSRNNSMLSGLSGPAGGSSGGGGSASANAGGMSKTKKQKQTVLGHGMGSGASVGRRSSLGSSSGHGGPIGSVVQPTQPAQSLMSIIEDVSKHNREWSQESSQLLKNRKKIVTALEKDKMGPVGMVDVVKAPPRVGRDELAQLNAAMIKARVMETSTMILAPPPGALSSASGGEGGGGGGGRLVDIKAPGSVFDPRKAGSALAVHRQASNSAPNLTQGQEVNVTQWASGTAGPVATSTPAPRGTKRPAKSPLRSALKNPSRTPSPLLGPFLVPHLQKQQQALQEGSRQSNVGVIVPVRVPPAQLSTILGPQLSQTQNITTMANGQPASDVPAAQRRKGKRQIKGAPDFGEAEDSTSTNDTEDEIFYTDDEGEQGLGETPVVHNGPILNGHAIGSSDLSHSTTSTTVTHRLPRTTTSSVSQLTTTSAPRRRKSVRVSLQPTFSPSPPAIDDDDEEEQKSRTPWVWKPEGDGGQQQLHVHAPIPVAAGSSLLLNPVHHRQNAVAPEPDIWQDSSDEDVEYQNAKRLLTRAARKEKDMKAFATGSRS